MLLGIKQTLVNLGNGDCLLGRQSGGRGWQQTRDQEWGSQEHHGWLCRVDPQRKRNGDCIMNREVLSRWAPAHCPVTGLAFWRMCTDRGKLIRKTLASMEMGCPVVGSCRASGSCTCVLSLADLHVSIRWGSFCEMTWMANPKVPHTYSPILSWLSGSAILEDQAWI